MDGPRSINTSMKSALSAPVKPCVTGGNGFKSHAEQGQDRWMNENVFHNYQNGRFVEIGTSNGVGPELLITLRWINGQPWVGRWMLASTAGVGK